MKFDKTITLKKGALTFLAVGIASILVELVLTKQISFTNPTVAAIVVSIARMGENYLKHRD